HRSLKWGDLAARHEQVEFGENLVAGRDRPPIPRRPHRNEYRSRLLDPLFGPRLLATQRQQFGAMRWANRARRGISALAGAGGGVIGLERWGHESFWC